MVSVFTAAVSSLTLSEAAQFLAGSLVAWEEDSVAVATQRLLHCALVVALVTLVAGFAVGSGVDVEASAEEIGEASGEASTVAHVAAALVVAIVASVVLLMVLVALPMLPAGLALPLADTAVDLTVIATTTGEVEDTDGGMMIEEVVATAAVAAVTIVPAQAATWSHLVLDKATAATAAVGIAIGATTTAEEAMTIAETTHASVHTKAALATRESGSCVDTNDVRAFGLVVGILSPLVSLFSSSSLPFRHQG